MKSYLLQCLLVLVVLIVIVIIILNLKGQKTIEKVEAKVEKKTEEKLLGEETVQAIEKIKVDVKGSVVNPGVYELEVGSRVSDAIFLAGGVTENGNTSVINLSKTVYDQMVIIVYTNEQIEEYKNGNKVVEYVYIEVEKCPDTVNDACIDVGDTNNNSNTNKTENNNEKAVEETPSTNESTITNENKLISLNKATVEELMTLPSIGESKAKAIIEYRNTNGNYKTIEDILNVSGIGNSVFEKIKDSITV